jgi:prolyl oligopeptidase
MNYPPTSKNPVTDEYYGIQVHDDFRWLEDSDDSAVKDWTTEQNKFTQSVLDRYPNRRPLYDRLEYLYSDTTIYFEIHYVKGRLFALKFQPPRQQPYLVSLTSPYDVESEKTVFDPNEYDSSGNTAIDFYTPSLDGQLMAISLSEGGSEDGSLHLFEVDSGKQLPDVISRVNYPTAGGSVAWNADCSGFYYTRYPHQGERSQEDMFFYQQVYFHSLGEPVENDTYVIGEEFPRIAEIELHTTEDARYLLALVRNGDGGEMAHYLRGPEDVWRQVTEFKDEIQEAALGPDGYLYLLSRRDAPRGQILRLPFADPDLMKAETIIPQRSGAIESFLPTKDLLYTVELDGGPSKLSVFTNKGEELPQVPVEPISSIWQMVRLEDNEILFRSMSFITPTSWYHYDPQKEECRRTALFFPPPEDFSDCEVVREFATSNDGTRVPLNIIRRKGTSLDGSNPTLLTGYGGYGISMTPYFNIRRRVWFDKGGIIAVANLRGGGEFGEEWHKDGYLTNKQNVFDDFIACARFLIERKYTNPDKLCIEGGSNGGLLMGAALTQHPELFRAVVSRVGIYDMLRVELDPNGEFNVTEFGTVNNPQHFEVLYDYSPYHRVDDGTHYPAVLLTTGEHDGRVNPSHSRKMTARLQEATGSENPVLLRVSTVGHGMGTSLDEMIAEETDIYAFLFDQLGTD